MPASAHAPYPAFEARLPSLARNAPELVVLTCEHASAALPAPWRWPPGDAALRPTHWAYDLGAADLTRELADDLNAPAVLSTFTRLLVDPNRAEGHDELFRRHAEGGRPVALNATLTPADADARLRRFYRPFHAAIDAAVGSSAAPVVLSIHSFTPVYDGKRRDLEVGVLYDEADALGEGLHARLQQAGFRTERNAPYSGKAGLMYSAHHHATVHGRDALELEVRQDLAVDAAFRARLRAAVTAALAALVRAP